MIVEKREPQAAPLQQPARQRLARLVTEMLAPVPVTSGLLILVAWRNAPTAGQAVQWVLLTVVLMIFLPYLYVLRGVRRRRLSDRHVRVRAQRPLVLLIGVTSIVVVLTLLVIGGAPRELVALVAAMLIGLAASLLVTLVWKISIHTAVVAGAIVILVLVFGPLLLVLVPLVGVVGWARVELRDHSLAQVMAGSGLGAVVAGVVFSLLR